MVSWLSGRSRVSFAPVGAMELLLMLPARAEQWATRRKKGTSSGVRACTREMADGTDGTAGRTTVLTFIIQQRSSLDQLMMHGSDHLIRGELVLLIIRSFLRHDADSESSSDHVSRVRG
jgi:hypothetical protein